MAIPNTLVYCISVPGSPRRETFSANAAKTSVSFQFFDAITINELRRGIAVEGCRVDLTNMSWIDHERRDPRRQRAPLLFTEIGCAYSHMKCWQRAKELNADHLIVFEDDVVIVRQPQRSDVPADADIVYLSGRMPHNERGEAAGRGCGTDAYLLTRSGIFKCLEIFRILYMPIDLQLIAHQRSQYAFGHGLTKYRRQIDNDLYLQAYVAANPVALYRKEIESQVA